MSSTTPPEPRPVLSATGGNLTITAGNTITDSGATSYKASGDATLKAGKNVTLGALTTQTRGLNRDNRYESTHTVTQTGTTITAGNDLKITAGAQSILQGTKAEADNDLSISSGTDTLIAATQTTQKVERGDGGFGQLWSTQVSNDLVDLKAGNDLSITSGLDTVANGVKLKADHDVNVSSLATTTITSPQDSFEQNIKTKKYTLIVDKKDTVRSTITAGNDVTVQATLGDVTLKSAEVKAGGKVTLAALNGDVNLSANKDVDFRHEVKTSTGGMWTTFSDQGHLDETVVHTKIDAGDGLTITVGTNGSVNVDYKDFGNLDKSIERLSQEPGLEWMAQVKESATPAQWNAIKEAHKSWSTSSKSMSPQAMMMITMIMTAVTMGAGGLWGVAANGSNLSLGGAVIGTGGGAFQTAMVAGINALAVSASTNLVANKGDLGATLKQLGSKDSIRSLAAAMVTAGVMQGLTNADLLPKGSFSELSAADALQKFAVQTTVRTAINAGISGQDLGDAAKQGLMTTATDMLASYTFHAIGDFAADQNSDLWKDGSPLKAVAHGVAGGFLARLNGQEFSAGAVSAAATELMSGALAEVDPQMRIQMAGMIGATAVMLTGGSAEDMQMGQTIAQSVALNNHMMHPEFKKLMDDKFEEEKEKYPSLTQEKLAKLQEACGKSHCFNTWLERWFGNGDISETDLKNYANNNGFGEFTSQEIAAFAKLHETTADAYRAEVALAKQKQ